MTRLPQTLFLTLCTIFFVGASLAPSQAQLVLVDEPFRIVDVDHDNNRIAIAKPDANPNVRQNWVYLDLDTRGSYRLYIPSLRAYRDKVLSARQVLNVADENHGQLMRVKGGRDWNGSIKAKTIHFKI